MPVIVSNKLIEPAPFLNIQKNVIVAGNQTKLGETYTLSIIGTLCADKGSPRSDGTFWTSSPPAPDESILQFHKLHALEQKQRALEGLFAINGQWIEWQSPDGSQPLKTQFKNARVSFPEGNWAMTCPYTITCECDLLYLNGDPVVDAPFPDFIQNATEDWSVNEGPAIYTFDFRHNVNAIGKSTFDNVGNQTQPAWKNAKDFVDQKLTLGFLGSSNYSPLTGQNIFNQSSLASGAVNFSSLSAYNYARAETVNELEGSYGVTENWTMAQGSGYEVFSININKISNDPYTTVHATIQGTIKGFYVNLFDYNTRMLAAEYVWSQVGVSGLYNRITSFINTPQVVLNPQAIVGTLDYNPNEGTITYHYEYDNRLLGVTNNAYEIYTITRATNAESYKSTFTIAGQVIGLRYDGDYDQTAAFQRASALWDTIKPNNGLALYNRIISSAYFPEASGIGLQYLPFTKDIQMNQSAGTINYSYIFDNRAEAVSIDGFSSENILDEYTCSRHYSRAEAIITYTIAGTVKGLNVVDTSNPYLAKYALASGYFYGYAYPNLYSRISSYYGVNLPWTVSQVEEIQEDPHLGQISYSVQFNNLYPPILPNVLSEMITVSESNWNQDVNTIASIPVPARLKGPVLQQINMSPVKTRTVNIEVVLPTAGANTILDAFQLKPNYNSFITDMLPQGVAYIVGDTDDFNWRFGRYQRQIQYIYE